MTRIVRSVRRVPPPITRAPGHHRLPCAEILEEFAGEPALLLWQTCRSVHLWALPGPGERLFSPGAAEIRRARLRAAGLEEGLLAPLEALASLLENPGPSEAPRVVEGCREVARWAEARGKLATALDFAQAAATADPEDPRLAVAVGRLARLHAEYERAESWFEHAIVLARGKRDWQAYTEAYAGLGNLYVQKGGLPRAKHYHLRCLRAAKRYSLHEMQGAALHNLFAVAVESEAYLEAVRFADAALSAYPAGSPGITRLAQDVAFYWISRGEFGPALVVMRELLPRFESRATRLVIHGHIARAAGGLGDSDAFEGAWARVWTALEEESAPPGAPQALIGLAYGAASLGEWTRAERALRRALDAATRRQEATPILEAERLLEVVGERRSAEQPAAEPLPEPVSERLVDRFTTVLRESRAVAQSA